MLACLGETHSTPAPFGGCQNFIMGRNHRTDVVEVGWRFGPRVREARRSVVWSDLVVARCVMPQDVERGLIAAI